MALLVSVNIPQLSTKSCVLAAITADSFLGCCSLLVLWFSCSLVVLGCSRLFSVVLGCSRLFLVVVRSQPSEFTQCTSHPRPTTGVLLPRTARGGSIGGAQVLLFAMFVRSVVARK